MTERLSAMDPRATREWLVRNCSGLGPKQASLFLRKTGYSDSLAVLDTHLIRFMRQTGLCSCDEAPPRLRAYERLETVFATYAASVGIALSRLDVAIWIVMRVASKGEFHGTRDARVRRTRFNADGRPVEGARPEAVSAFC